MKFLHKIFLRSQPNYFVSTLGQFLLEFDRQHPEKSASQNDEITKQARISYLRDNIVPSEKQNKIWENF